MEVGKIMESLLKAGADGLRQPDEQASKEDVSPGKNPEESQEDEIPRKNLHEVNAVDQVVDHLAEKVE